MKQVWNLLAVLTILSGAGIGAGTSNLHAADSELAEAFAVSAAKLNSQGKLEKAKQLCFKALANDEKCAEALYQLGLIYQKEGRIVRAGNFFANAARGFSKDASEEAGTKMKDAKHRAQQTNPYAMRLQQVMTLYTRDLDAIAKKNPDRIMMGVANERAKTLNLAHYVPPGEMPSFASKSTPPPTTRKPEPKRPSRDPWGRRRSRSEPEDEVAKPAANSVPPAIERALKSAGWSTISGTWKKTSPTSKVYEVTDGKLVAQKKQGAVSVIVHAGSKGKVSVLVRAKKRLSFTTDFYGRTRSSSESMSGFGFTVSSSSAAVYTPINSYGSDGTGYVPYKEFDQNLPAFPKNIFMVSIVNNKLEMYLNQKKLRSSKYPLDDDGDFVIEISGTRKIELPQAGGR